MSEDVEELLGRVPEGWSEATYDGRRWGVTRTTRADGRSASVYAEALDGSGVVSTNAYALASGWVLKPCEMPLSVVVDFLVGVGPTPSDRSSTAAPPPRPRRPSTCGAPTDRP